MTEVQLEELRKAYAPIIGIDPASPTYKRLIAFLDAQTSEVLKQLAGAEIKFISGLARNRVRNEQ